eukprot:2614180-Lingulodinium_polyedra.AAC.1
MPAETFFAAPAAACLGLTPPPNSGFAGAHLVLCVNDVVFIEHVLVFMCLNDELVEHRSAWIITRTP